MVMLNGRWACTVGALLALGLVTSSVKAEDDSKYPDWRGAWVRFVDRSLGGQPSFDQTKPWGLGQQAPLTPEYQKILEDSLADQANGGQGNWIEHAKCHPAGMPFMMVASSPMEIVVTPDATYVLAGGSTDHLRRIFTDGREWPDDIEPSYSGYSIGKWIDEGGDGRYNLLEVETRGPFRGHRAFDPTGLPLHFDNQSVFKERIRLDKADPNVLHDEMTVIDHALTRPWTVDKRYLRNPKNPRPRWTENPCPVTTTFVFVGNESYYLSTDGKLMPVTKNQPPPDLKYFNQTQK
jgi:hypothetical protein